MFEFPKEYDVIVVGAGHAGVEAALAAARMNCQTLLLTMNVDTVGQMSCNPAIGGPAKGQLAREIDAMGGEMAKAADMAGFQFRMLNTKKGPAVWSPRAQCDKKAYQLRLKWICEKEPNLDLKQGVAEKLTVRNEHATGIQTNLGIHYSGKAVVLTTGTFLRGLIHIGPNKQIGGRLGEASAVDLSNSLTEIGLELGRLKTGTPPRLLRRSIDFTRTQAQSGDEPVPYFTFWRDDLFHVEQPVISTNHANNVVQYPPGSVLARLNGQLPCYITRTTAQTVALILTNLHRSPLYSGRIKGIGPRYCPSIEDKIVKFHERETHQIFLEPEGAATDEIYVNGLSTSLPLEIQLSLVRTILGCERAEIIRPGYAVEYDYCFPTQLDHSLQTKVCGNLYLAGQINGTSGYEEAAAQGIMAGVNAARRVHGLSAMTLRRDQAYIGVLIDDLVTKGTSEPYRLFTSRAEYRLLLRHDNADLRLSPSAFENGLLPEHKYRLVQNKRTLIDAEIQRLHETRCGRHTLAKLLSRPEVRYEDLPSQNANVGREITQQVEISIKYAGYIERQAADTSRFGLLECKEIPRSFDYSSVPSLRIEARQKLAEIRPSTLGQASRIPGVSPADIGLLAVWLKRTG